jgi:hypothetical protein
VPSRSEVQLSVCDDAIFSLGDLAVGASATKLERTLQCDCHGETPRGFRLNAKNFAASGELYARVGQVRDCNRQLYCGALGNQKGARKKNASETDVLRVGEHFFVGKFD